MKKKTLLLGAFWSGSKFFLNLIRSIFLVPIFISVWSEESYSFWIIIMSFQALLQTLNLGYVQYLGNKINLKFHKNPEFAFKTFGEGIGITSFIFLIQIICSLLFLFDYPLSILLGIPLPSIEYEEINIALFIFMTFCTFNHIILRLFTRLFEPLGKVDISAKIGVLTNFFELLIMFVGLSLFNIELSDFLILLGSYYFLSSGFILFYTFINLPHFFKYISIPTLKKIYNEYLLSSGFLFTNILEKINNESLPLIISFFLNLTFVPIYYTIRILSNIIITAGDLFLGLLIPDMQKFFVTKKGDNLIRVCNTYWFFLGLIINLGVLIVFPFAEDFFNFWVKSKLKFNQTLFTYLIINALIVIHGNVFLYFIKSINNTKQIFSITILKTLIFYFSIIMLEKNISSIGLALIFSSIYTYTLFLNFLVAKKVKSFGFNNYNINYLLGAFPFLISILYLITWIYFDGIIVVTLLIFFLLIYYYNYYKILKNKNMFLKFK